MANNNDTVFIKGQFVAPILKNLGGNLGFYGNPS